MQQELFIRLSQPDITRKNLEWTYVTKESLQTTRKVLSIFFIPDEILRTTTNE